MDSWLSIRPAPVREGSVSTDASDDIVRQFRYYLLIAEAPEIALRFREAVRRTIQSLAKNPHVGP
jgi:plasmid stabilization system protein ParE